MKKLIGLVVILGLAAAIPASAQKVTIDYAHDFDFSTVKTFQYVDTPDTNPRDALLAGRIVSALKRVLVEDGLTEVEDGGDLLVTYHVTSQDNQVMTSTHMGMGGAGMGPGWGGWGHRGMGMGMGMGTTTTRTATFTEGTLIIDAYDSTGEQLIWRGTGTVTVKDNPKKRNNQINNILDKLGKRWKRILDGKGK